MKKTRIVALVLIVSIMLVGAGYAAWNDRLSIEGNISTGDLDIVFIKSNIRSSSDNIAVKSSIDPDKKAAFFEVSNMYPGSSYYADLAVENKGTIPATIDHLNIKKIIDQNDILQSDNLVLYEKIKISGAIVILDKNNEFIKKIGSFKYKNLIELEDELEDMLVDEILLPGQIIAFCGIDRYSKGVCFELDSNSGNETEAKKLCFSLELDWKQKN